MPWAYNAPRFICRFLVDHRKYHKLGIWAVRVYFRRVSLSSGMGYSFARPVPQPLNNDSLGCLVDPRMHSAPGCVADEVSFAASLSSI